jgi:hypothetical protein
MTQIDRPGTYRGKVTEHSLGFTKNGYPQVVARFQATEKWVDEATEMEHFEMTEPGWVEWDFGETVIYYGCLFNSTESYDENSKLLSYDQLVTAWGWDGASFAELGDGTSFIGQKILFRVEEREFDGKTKLEVTWLDSYDADPVRRLRPAEADDIKAMQARMKLGKAAKPKAAKAKPAAAKPASKAESKPSSPPAAEKKSAPPSTPPKAAKAESKPEPAPEDDSLRSDWPAEQSQGDAWATLHEAKGDRSNEEVADAWIEAASHIVESSGTDEEDLTDEQWAQVRDFAADALEIT